MILDIEQAAHTIKISYLSEDGNKQLLQLPVDCYKNWTIVPQGQGTPGYEDITGKPVAKLPGKRYARFDMLELLHNLPEDVQQELFAYRQANLVACDIETDIADRFPRPELAEQPVNCISVVDSNMNILLYTTKVAHGACDVPDCIENGKLIRQGRHVDDIAAEILSICRQHLRSLLPPHEQDFTIQIFEFDTEAEMLRSYFGNVVRNAAVLTFWNGNGFDKPYLLNRCRILSIDPAIGSITGTTDFQSGAPRHTVFTDYMQLVKDHGKTIKNVESYKLDYIAKRVLNVGKLPYAGSLKWQTENDIPTFLAYNVIDSAIVQLVHRQLNMMSTLYGFSQVCKLELVKANSQVAQTESLVSLDCLDKLDWTGLERPEDVVYANKRVAAINPNKTPQRKYDGGHVKQPHKRIANHTACIDFSGLYPSIHRSFNISVDNFVGPIDMFNAEAQNYIVHHTEKYFVSVNRNVYKNDHDYAYRRIQRYLRAKRDVHKRISSKHLSLQQPFIEYALWERGLWKEKPILDANIDSLPWKILAGDTWYDIDICKLNEKDADGNYVREDMFVWHCFHTNLREGFFHFNMQIAFKLVANSLYGATANVANTFGNVDVADDTTAEGRNAIQCAEMLINNWMNFDWPTDIECHQWLIDRFPGQFTKLTSETAGNMPPIEKRDRIMYIDTDSLYVEYDDLMETTGFTGDKVDFFSFLYEEFLGKRVNKALADMCNGRGGKSMMKFDLEYVTEGAVFCAKKMYLFAMAAEDGRKYQQPWLHLKVKGMDIARSALSDECRAMVKHAVEKLLIGEIKTKADYLRYMTECWRTFQTYNLEQISKRISISADKYFKYISQDNDEVHWNSGALPQYRGAAFYNYHIHARHLDNSLERIQDGYVCTYFDIWNNPFSFRIFECPDWAPEANYAIQFVKNVVGPIDKVAKWFDVVVKLDHLFGGTMTVTEDEDTEDNK